MLLAVDVRNRSISLGFHDGEGWIVLRELGASSERSADEYGWSFARAFSEAASRPGLAGARVDRAIVSSVAPALTPRIVAAISSAFGVSAHVVGPGSKTGVKIRSDLPQEVGSDIVCAAAAARRLVVGAPCVVIDFGDAIVFSALNAEGDFVGAAIAPGLEAASQSLHTGAALLPQVPFERPDRAIGRTTRASIQSGLYHGYAGLVERLAALFRAELAGAAGSAGAAGAAGNAAAIEVLVTGRSPAEEFVAGLQPCRHVESLALEGLVIIAGLVEGVGGGRQREHGLRQQEQRQQGPGAS